MRQQGRRLAFWASVAVSCHSPATTDSTDGTTGTEDLNEDASTGAGFIEAVDPGPANKTCDLLASTCEPGHKCSPVSTKGGPVADVARCVPVAAAARTVDEPCSVEAFGSGLDNCAAGLTCWSVDRDTLQGLCVPLCVAEDNRSPRCVDPDRRCLRAGGPLIVCLSACDPRESTCEPSQGCYPLAEWLLCADDASGSRGAAGSPCAARNGCDPGHWCAPPSEVAGCESTGCCASFCTLDDPTSCADPAAVCVPWEFERPAPSTLSTLGRCVTSTSRAMPTAPAGAAAPPFGP